MVEIIDAYNNPEGFVEVPAVNIAAAAAGVGSVPAHTKAAYIQVEGGDIRWRDDGTDPTNAIGTLVTDGNMIKYNGKLSAIKFIKASGTPKLNVTFYS